MLLPSTAANPASMMAQAMTIYKSLVGTDLRGDPSKVSLPVPTDDGKGDDSTRQADDSPISNASTPDAFPVEPVFSLRSPKDRS